MIAGAAFIPSAHASAFSAVVPSIFVYVLMAPRWNSNRDGARKAKAHPVSCNHAQNIRNCGMVVALNQLCTAYHTAERVRVTLSVSVEYYDVR